MMTPLHRRIMRRFALKEISGVDRPAQQGARVVIMKRDDPSATPMSDRLADRIDDFKRIYPRLSDEDHYAMAWSGLSLSDRAKVRDEESGAHQERIAEEERSRARSMRNEDLSMKNIDTGALAMIALEGAAEALRKSNPSLTREQAFSRVYQDPANRIAAMAERQAARQRFAEHAASSYTGDNLEKRVLVTQRDAALDALKAKAAELRKANPELTELQAFAKVYGDPANRALAAAERSASWAALYAV